MLKGLRRVAIRVLVLAGLCAGFCIGQQGRVSRGGRTNASGRGAGSAIDPNAPKGVYPTSQGVVKSVSGSQLLLEVDDEHEMKFRITRKTKVFSQDKQGMQEIKASSLHPGQNVAIDMQTGLDGSFEAIRIILEAPKAKEAPAENPK